MSLLIILWRLVDFEFQLLDNNRVLRIYRAHLEKGGAFQCVAENSEGIAVANFLIELENVKGKTTVIFHTFKDRHSYFPRINPESKLSAHSSTSEIGKFPTLLIKIVRM